MSGSAPADYSHIDSDNIDSIYENLIKGNEEVALSTLPKKPKSRKNPLSLDTNVTEARENLKKILSIYHSHPSRTNNDKLTAAKKSLDNAYFEAEEAFISGKIDDISNLHINQQHSAAWKTINELSGKGSKSPTTTGTSGEKRLENWLSHFESLLGHPAALPENKSLSKV